MVTVYVTTNQNKKMNIPLYEQVNELEQQIWKSNNREARNEWDSYSDDLLGRNVKETWDGLYDSDLNDAIRTGQEVIDKFNL
jgi:hypothetical protein